MELLRALKNPKGQRHPSSVLPPVGNGQVQAFRRIGHQHKQLGARQSPARRAAVEASSCGAQQTPLAAPQGCLHLFDLPGCTKTFTTRSGKGTRLNFPTQKRRSRLLASLRLDAAPAAGSQRSPGKYARPVFSWAIQASWFPG